MPSEDVGGVVVGEADRVDLGPNAGVDFNPDNRVTWGNGGRAPLLIDPCQRGSTHSMVIGGGGTYKSTTLVTTLLTWRKSAFVLDPAEELADLVGAELKDRGRKVVRLGIGSAGPNVLDGIDVTDTMAETRLRAIAGRVIGPIPDDDKGGKFKRWGRTIILALLAHMMWDPNTPAERKTLRALRDGLDGGEEAVRNRLRGIAESSSSPLAKSLASTMWGMVKETFDGALGNATEDTEWLASEAYADLVSGNAYRMSELVGGNLVVFCQVPQEALEHTPAVARGWWAATSMRCSLPRARWTGGCCSPWTKRCCSAATRRSRSPAIKGASRRSACNCSTNPRGRSRKCGARAARRRGLMACRGAPMPASRTWTAPASWPPRSAPSAPRPSHRAATRASPAACCSGRVGRAAPTPMSMRSAASWPSRTSCWPTCATMNGSPSCATIVRCGTGRPSASAGRRSPSCWVKQATGGRCCRRPLNRKERHHVRSRQQH